MANSLYAKAKEAFLNADIDMASDTIKVVLVDGETYTPNLTTDDFLDDIPAGERVATSGALSGKTMTGGVFDADDVTISGVSGDQFEYMVLFKDTGSAATSPLIAIWDTVTGLPFTPSGSDIVITWPAGASKIFAL